MVLLYDSVAKKASTAVETSVILRSPRPNGTILWLFRLNGLWRWSNGCLLFRQESILLRTSTFRCMLPFARIRLLLFAGCEQPDLRA